MLVFLEKNEETVLLIHFMENRVVISMSSSANNYLTWWSNIKTRTVAL